MLFLRSPFQAQEQWQLAEQEEKQPVAAMLPQCYPEEVRMGFVILVILCKMFYELMFFFVFFFVFRNSGSYCRSSARRKAARGQHLRFHHIHHPGD